ncbi:nicotinate-nucleotide-dimethylbenzimidazole phosphoribosyltransferase /cob(II)yrinic acid a,c-diamide reductase [Pedobacter westerhofensis]|uniref:Nicotinate-nucleotide--dimethylbenzimidazole phosphoribosyltransferase n=1 Tax=Pedobacter westerhofensis TaxID=425512 RepID=A0A521C0S5_9SPHI|nr:nicotinate-nucleotide--dimethylbenzimidazole phosphoribosyltransferase [Pedobacter westerhofensis]SMO53049.1 nicotinate-nucleotide-dimethylbenzimidazole phosphoribosyltransferase /cob(II)yrinic acid a,c-diamide reductase [Pedobacter westerhofensis]
MLEDLLKLRRDTRHFTNEPVPDSVLQKALMAGHMAPSVGLTDATRYYIIRSGEVKLAVKHLFDNYSRKAEQLIETDDQKSAYRALKLEGITDAPIGLVVCYDRSVLNEFTIGTIATNDTIRSSAVCAIQNIWLSLTEQGYSMGWVSILNYHQFKKILNLPDEIEPLGYFCVGKPATDYEKQPMLQQLGWKNKSELPAVAEIDSLSGAASVESSTIVPADHQNVSAQLSAAIDGKTKPLGSLGMLEDLALQIGTVLGTLSPQITDPQLVVFAADHGIAHHGVSAYPQEVTRQMVNNFLDGGAAINVFCRQHQIALKVVDAGVNYDFAPNADLIVHKIAKGTQSFLYAAAMSAAELELCLQKGAEVVAEVQKGGSNTIGFGEMGIGNTSSASVLMHLLCGLPLQDCVGKGTGVNAAQLQKKQEILQLAISRYQGSHEVKHLMAHFGGFEMMQIAGAMLEAKKRNLLILVDGFICTVAYLCAFKLDPELQRNAIFCHQSDEQGHRLLLEQLNAKALLKLDLRLGEGTGCALAFPLLKSAVDFLNDMASFESAEVSTGAV